MHIIKYENWRGETPAMVSGMSNGAYHTHDAISASGLKLMARSPAHYRHQAARSPSRDMVIGSAIHCALLEPKDFARRYVCSGTSGRRASEYKQAVKAVGSDEYVLTQPEHDRIVTMQQSVLGHASAGHYLSDSSKRTELSVFATCQRTGVAIKCRPDLVTQSGVMIDLKKTQDARPEAFARSVSRYGYDMAAAHYIDTWEAATGAPPSRYLLIAVEEDPPHGIGVYKLPQDWIEYGRSQKNTAMDDYAQCLESGHWPAYDDGEQLLMPPRWVEAEMDNDVAEEIR